MKVIGLVGSDLIERKSKGGPSFFTFRLAEGFGKGDKRETVWYDVVAFIPESQALSFKKGERVAVSGKPEIREFERKGGGRGASIAILAFSVEHP